MTTPTLNHLALEITQRCNLVCASHCYAMAGPTGSHGTMTPGDWQAVITDAVRLGVEEIQLIGGEPTQSPHWVDLLRFALAAGLRVEVFSNLTAIRDVWWTVLEMPGVSLATSYYSDQGHEHDAITGRSGSHAKTRKNITEAVQRGIPIRASIVEVLDGQRIEAARAELESLGVTRIRIDRKRAIGNGAHELTPETAELCGRCGQGKAAISPDGEVWPCVMGRFLVAGNVREDTLTTVLSGQRWDEILKKIPATTAVCDPDCNPASDGGDCSPAETLVGK